MQKLSIVSIVSTLFHSNCTEIAPGKAIHIQNENTTINKVIFDAPGYRTINLAESSLAIVGLNFL